MLFLQSSRPDLEVLNLEEETANEEVRVKSSLSAEECPERKVAANETPKTIKSILLSHRTDSASGFGECRRACLLGEDEEHDEGACTHRENNSRKSYLTNCA